MDKVSENHRSSLFVGLRPKNQNEYVITLPPYYFNVGICKCILRNNLDELQNAEFNMFFENVKLDNDNCKQYFTKCNEQDAFHVKLDDSMETFVCKIFFD